MHKNKKQQTIIGQAHFVRRAVVTVAAWSFGRAAKHVVFRPGVPDPGYLASAVFCNFLQFSAIFRICLRLASGVWRLASGVWRLVIPHRTSSNFADLHRFASEPEFRVCLVKFDVDWGGGLCGLVVRPGCEPFSYVVLGLSAGYNLCRRLVECTVACRMHGGLLPLGCESLMFQRHCWLKRFFSI